MDEIVASKQFQFFALPAIFLLITVALKAITRIKHLREYVLDVLQVGIELCMLNLSMHTAMLLVGLKTPLFAAAVAFWLIGFLLITVCCAFLQGLLFPKYPYTELLLADILGFVTFAFGTYNLLRLVGRHNVF